MDRRHFSKISLLSVAGLTACSSHGQKIKNGIDSHCHIWAPNSSKDFQFKNIQNIATPSGIQRFVVVVIYEKENESYVVDMKNKFPGKIGIISLLDPSTPQLEQKMKLNRNKGVMGYRLNSKNIGDAWLNDTDMMWEIAADLDLSMCLLRKPNASITSMKKMIHKHQKTKVVIDHLGLVNPDNKNEVEEFLSLAEYEKCFVKVSHFFENREEQSGTKKMHKLFEQVYQKFGSERLMWGSNAPVEVSQRQDYKRAVDLVREASFLKAADKQNIFVNTAEKLFF